MTMAQGATRLTLARNAAKCRGAVVKHTEAVHCLAARCDHARMTRARRHLTAMDNDDQWATADLRTNVLPIHRPFFPALTKPREAIQ